MNNSLAPQSYGDSLIFDVLAAITGNSTLDLSNRNLSAVDLSLLSKINTLWNTVNSNGIKLSLARNTMRHLVLNDILSKFISDAVHTGTLDITNNPGSALVDSGSLASLAAIGWTVTN